MRSILAALIAFVSVILPIASKSQTLPSTDDMRGALYVCSGGYVKSQEFKGGADLEAFIGLLRRSLGAAVEGGAKITEEEVGEIFSESLGDGERFASFQIYSDCLKNFVLPIIQGSEGAGPGIQSGKYFTIIAHEAISIGKLAIVTIGMEVNRVINGTLTLERESFRAFTKSGAVYKLGDAGGLDKCDDESCGFSVNSGDNIAIILTFEWVAGQDPKNFLSNETISFTGRMTNRKYGGPDNYVLGLRGVPLLGTP